MDNVYEVLYLIFNEGFHSNHKELLVRKDLCGEALRLTKLLLTKEQFRTGNTYALFALMCFHSSRLESKVNEDLESIDLKNQDRTKWFMPLVHLGNNAMQKASEYQEYSTYHIESFIALEHLRAKTFDETNWNRILNLYEQLYQLQPNDLVLLSKVVILLQINKNELAKNILDNINPQDLEQKKYLYFGVLAEYHQNTQNKSATIEALNQAITFTNNEIERKYLENKLTLII